MYAEIKLLGNITCRRKFLLCFCIIHTGHETLFNTTEHSFQALKALFKYSKPHFPGYPAYRQRSVISVSRNKRSIEGGGVGEEGYIGHNIPKTYPLKLIPL